VALNGRFLIIATAGPDPLPPYRLSTFLRQVSELSSRTTRRLDPHFSANPAVGGSLFEGLVSHGQLPSSRKEPWTWCSRSGEIELPNLTCRSDPRSHYCSLLQPLKTNFYPVRDVRFWNDREHVFLNRHNLACATTKA